MTPQIYKSTFDVYLPATKNNESRFVETVEVDVYRNFGEEFLTPESSERIEQIKVRYLGLLTGKDIKALREQLNLTQDQMSDLLQCGEKSLSRWENGRGYPSGMVNTMLRLLEESRVSLTDLKAVSGPREPVADESFVHKRSNKVIPYNFREHEHSDGDAEDCDAEDCDAEYLQPAMNS